MDAKETGNPSDSDESKWDSDAEKWLKAVGAKPPIRLRTPLNPDRHGMSFTGTVTPQNAVEMAGTQLPRFEAKVLMHREMQRTKRLLILVAAVCLIAGAALIVFAPSNKEGVSYVVAASLIILPLGAIGVQEFRIRTIGVRIEGGKKAVETANHGNK